MIVVPYKTKHGYKRLVFVDPEGQYVSEDGRILKPHMLAEDRSVRCFCAWETARKLTTEGRGESLLWNGEHIRWRPFKFPHETEWRRRPFDAYVLRVPMYSRSEDNLRSLCRWRDWLYEYRALPATMGGSSMSLLRARVARVLVCSKQWDTKRIVQSAGGRITLGPNGRGSFSGQIVHWDLPAAYATQIGTLRYGGMWRSDPNHSIIHLDTLVETGAPVFVRAQAYIPKSLTFGPLCRRYRKPLHPFRAQMMLYTGERYPTGCTMQGWWTWEELQSARAVGCSVKILDVWHHASPPKSPFVRWWEAVQEGRELQGLSGLLAKTTGNALWGNFAFDPAVRGKKSIHSRTASGFTSRHPRILPRIVNAIELAEVVAGRTRAKLYDAMVEMGDDLICAHTDGFWARADNGREPSGEWRVKETAHRIDVLSPQNLRYHTGGRKHVIYSGVPMEQAEAAFDVAWGAYLEAA